MTEIILINTDTMKVFKKYRSNIIPQVEDAIILDNLEDCFVVRRRMLANNQNNMIVLYGLIVASSEIFVKTN